MKKLTNEQFMKNFTIIQIDGETKEAMMRDAANKVDEIIDSKLNEYKEQALKGNAGYIVMYNTLMSNKNTKKNRLLESISVVLDSELVEIRNHVKTD